MAEASSSTGNQEKSENDNESAGRHWTLLNKALKRTTKKTMSSIKLPLFLSQFAPISAKYPDEVKKLHSEFTEETLLAIDSEIQKVLEQENVCVLMNKLDEVTCNKPASPTEAAWRPSGNPKEDLRAHEMAVKLKHKQKLELILAACQRETEQLERSVMSRRQQLALVESKVTQDFDSAMMAVDVPIEQTEEFLKQNMS